MQQREKLQVVQGRLTPLTTVVFLVQSRAGSFEFVLSPERLCRDGVVFVSDVPLGHREERLLVDVCLDGGASSDAIDIVAGVVRYVDGVGTHVRFCWDESSRESEERFTRYLELLSAVKPGCDYLWTPFALAA